MYRALPTWLQWALPLTIAAAVVVALIAFVHHQTVDVPQIANVTSKSAIVEQNREATILVRQQQRPHVVRLKAGESGVAGLRAAVVGYMDLQIRHGAMAGPLKRASCRPVAGGTSSRLVVHCDVTAGEVTYPFDGVASAGVATYCQRIAPPVPSMNIPVSKRCT